MAYFIKAYSHYTCKCASHQNAFTLLISKANCFNAYCFITLACGFYNKTVKVAIMELLYFSIFFWFVYLEQKKRQDQTIKRTMYDRTHLKAWRMTRMWQGELVICNDAMSLLFHMSWVICSKISLVWWALSSQLCTLSSPQMLWRVWVSSVVQLLLMLSSKQSIYLTSGTKNFEFKNWSRD